jgi:Conidiation protein 6.
MDEGDIPQEVPASEDYAKDPENVLRGHKATISNPRASRLPGYQLLSLPIDRWY